MSKERELLQICLDEFEYKGVACNELCIDINKLLAQPEQDLDAFKKDWVNFGYTAGKREQLLAQPEQEPVAWQLVANFITDGDILQYTYSKPRDELYEYYRVTPLYTSPPTRDPLSDEEIDKGYQESDRNYYDLAFRDGVCFAEKAHGIGVDNESI